MSACSFCEKQKPDDGMRLCAECSNLADDVFEEIGFDPENILRALDLSSTRSTTKDEKAQG